MPVTCPDCGGPRSGRVRVARCEECREAAKRPDAWRRARCPHCGYGRAISPKGLWSVHLCGCCNPQGAQECPMSGQPAAV